MSKNKEYFNNHYNKGGWGSDPTNPSSGGGSTDKNAVSPGVEAVKNFIKKQNIKTITDLGCGDFQVASQIFPYCDSYTACDASSTILEIVSRKFNNDKLRFVHLDICEDNIPKAELGTIRQVLQHLSNEDIQSFVNHLNTHVPFKFLIVSEHLPKGDFVPNKDKPSDRETRIKKKYGCSGVDLAANPFNLFYKSSTILCESPTHNIMGIEGIIRTTLYEF